MSKTAERYLVKEAIHVGPIRRQVMGGDVLSWTPASKKLLINGKPIIESAAPFSPSEAMRQLKLVVGSSGPILERLPDVPEKTDETRPKTQTLCVLPILGCLAAARDFLRKGLGLVPVNELQKEFIALYSEKMKDTDLVKELERIADKDISVINKWLKVRGFDLELSDKSGSGAIAVASALNVLEKWVKKGKETTINTDKGEFPAVLLGKDVQVSYDPRHHVHPVVRVRAKNGDLVCMSMIDQNPVGTFGIHREVHRLKLVQNRSRWDGVIFPMIDYKRNEDILWIIGMFVTGEWFIDQAIQSTEFRMNEDGARAKSAVAMTLCKGSSGPDCTVIDKPFLLWIERKGIDQPLFGAVFAEDVWKRPKCL